MIISPSMLTSVMTRCFSTVSADIISKRPTIWRTQNGGFARQLTEVVELASYLVYKAYRDGKFTEKPSDKFRYLRKAVDKSSATPSMNTPNI